MSLSITDQYYSNISFMGRKLLIARQVSWEQYTSRNSLGVFLETNKITQDGGTHQEKKCRNKDLGPVVQNRIKLI